MRLCLSVLSCLLLLASGSARALDTEAFFLGLDVRDGLPQETVEVVLRDSRGFLWIGTQGGLARWDGHRMRLFRRDPHSPNSLPGNSISALAEGSDGRLWVATLQAGVAAIAPDTGRIERFGRDQGLASEHISALAVAPDGTVWLGHPGAGLSRLDPENGTAASLGLDQEVIELAVTDEGLWVATASGLSFMPWQAALPESVALRPEPTAGDNVGMQGLDVSSGWPVVAAAYDGLWIEDAESGEFHRRELPAPDGGHARLTDVVRAPDGTLWVSSMHGLWWLSADGSRAERLASGRDNHQLPDTALFHLHHDAQGLLWIGTDNQGLWRMIRPPDGVRVQQISHHGEPVSTWLVEAHEGSLWLGTQHNGLLALSEGGGKDGGNEPEAAYLFDAESGLGDDIRALGSGNAGLWVATSEMRLYRLRDGRLEALPEALSGIRRSPAGFIWDLMEDADGRVWMTTSGDGLHRYDPASGAVDAWRAEGAERHGLDEDRLTVLHQDPDGRIWVGSEGSGLYMRPRDSDRFQHFPANEHALPGGMVEVIRHDSRGNIWVGTYDGGVARLAPDGGIRRLTEAEGLPSNTVVGLEVDDRDRVWIMTDLGLARLGTDGRLHRFGLAQGLPPILLHVGAHDLGSDGTVVFGGADGLIAFSPDAQLTQSASQAELRVTDVRVMGEPVWASDRTSEQLVAWREQGLQLSHDQPAISLDYALDDLTQPSGHRYRHRLDGLESDWHYTSATRASATYTNLDPGHYRLELQVATPDGAWQSAEPVAITVLSPPWFSLQAKIAYMLILAAVLAIGILLWRRRSRRETILRREREQRQWIEQLHELASRLAEPADRTTLLERFLQHLMQLLPIEAASVRLARSGRLPPVRVGVEQSGASPVSSDDRRLESLSLATRRRVLGELHVRPRKARPLNARDHAALAAATDQAAQALDMFLLVVEAEAANKAKSAFLAKLSHEIRTPVSGMLGLAGLLLRESLEARSRDYARAIQSSGQGLMAILSDILDYARIEAGRMEIHPGSFDVVAAMEDTAALHAVEASRRDIAVITHVSRDIPARIITDEVRFRQILGNLMSNAVKFTEAGCVTAELRRYDAGRLCLRVSDTGPGLSQAAADRLFQPFSRAETADSVEGAGLGLVICRELARLLGGEIRLDSRPGEGALFQVVFEADSDGGQRPSTLCRQPLCLVGPDNPAMQMLHKRFSEAGMRVAYAGPAEPENAEGQMVLVLDQQGIYPVGCPDDRLHWPLREARLAEWLDRLSGHVPDSGRLADAPSSRSPSLHAGESTGNFRLLLAEDNPINARVVSDVLFTAGYRVDVVSDGQQALDRLEATAYDLVLMDRHMPRLDGLSAVRRLRDRGYRDLPVIGLTAAVSSEEHADCRSAGMDQVVVKDGDPGPMLQVIRDALEGRKEL